MLEISGLNAWYGESHILHGVDFEVREGEVVTLLGRNGAGKTTTMKSIMGLPASPCARRNAASSVRCQ
jgi:branched-chain amino acid transport system ATP-binding protein